MREAELLRDLYYEWFIRKSIEAGNFKSELKKLKKENKLLKAKLKS